MASQAAPLGQPGEPASAVDRPTPAGKAGPAALSELAAGAGEAGLDWWRTGVVYQIYPRSFADSNGDGLGDLPGIVSRLDYLAGTGPDGLGVDAIWLSPIYPSPGHDVGYDVSDFVGIDPKFGSLADFEQLVQASHARGLRVILDLVLNHSSHLHPWFVDSRSSRTSEHADWYIWRDPAGRSLTGRPLRPNNWRSWFGGPAWTWDEGRQQFYLHTFLPEQPDLNWRQPAVRAAMLDVVRVWLERGVDGFRFDVFNLFFKDADLRSNSRRLGGRGAYSWQRHLYDKNQPELAAALAEIRALVDERPGRMTVGEPFEVSVREAASFAAPGHLVFDFSLIQTPWDAQRFGRTIAEREAAFGPNGWPTVVLSNHDRSRHASRFGEGRHGDARAKVAATMLLTLRGSPFMYYGEEIGLCDVAIPRDEIVDPPARRANFLSPWWNRDQARAPMPWGPGPNGGFSSAPPWLRMARDADQRNVVAQAANPGSVLNHYRRLIELRRSQPALRTGSYEQVDVGRADVLAYVRKEGDQTVLVVLGFEPRTRQIRLPAPPSGRAWQAALSTHEPLPEADPAGGLELRPLEAAIFVAR